MNNDEPSVTDLLTMLVGKPDEIIDAIDGVAAGIDTLENEMKNHRDEG